MHLVSRLHRILAMMTVLISLLAGLGVASAQADAPIFTGGGGRQTPRVAKQTPGTLPSNATSTPLPSPSPIQTTTPLSPTASPETTSSTTGTPDSAEPIPAKSAEKTDAQASHTVRFDPNNGSKPTQSTVQTGTLAAPLGMNPVHDGFRFDGWMLDGQPFDFQTPILQDMTLIAKWTKVTDWTLSPDHGPASGARLTISPPSRQEPCYVNIYATGDRFIGLTGDGRIYTWAQDGTPKQVPFPAHAPDGFHYLQATAGSRRQAALGSDQHIYTWANEQAAPEILHSSQKTKFSSISISDDRLLAVDQQGQIHTYQASQNPNPKPTEQETISLPGKVQAVLAAASSSRILIVDSDGQAWRWDVDNTGKAKTTSIKHDPGMRIIQAQALNQGILLLDADGQANYLADSTNSLAPVSLPDGAQIGRINSSNDQVMITGKDGRLWAWKPGKAPRHADNGNQLYVQAASTGSRITAISRQGDIFTWNLDEQGKAGKPDRIDTSTAPILESASMDSQTLTLGKNNGSWQADIPARKPGQAAILIAGRQDGQSFTRSLTYTVDRPLMRGAEPRSTLTVHFDTGGGKPQPADQHFPTTNGRVKRPSPDPAREGFQFDGWFIGQAAYDFSRPVTKDLTLTAKWSPESRNSSWSISPNKGSQLGRESTTITPPDGASRGIRFSQVSGSQAGAFSLTVGSDGNAYAWGDNSYGQLGNGTRTNQNAPVRVKTPDRNTYPDLPEDFTYLQVSAGGDHSLAVGGDGYAWAWGCNLYGNLGNSSGSSSVVPVRVRDPSSPTDKSKGLQAAQVSGGYHDSLAVGSDGNAYAWGYNNYGQLGDGTTSRKSAPVPVSFNLQLVITGVRFDQTAASGLTRGDGSSVTVTTPAHQPGPVTVSVDYTLGGTPQTPDTSLRYTYLPAGVLPKAGGEGILLALTTGMTGMGGVLASRRHRREQHRLLHASHE